MSSLTSIAAPAAPAPGGRLPDPPGGVSGSDPRLVRALQRSARAAAALVMLSGALVLLGWQLDLHALQAIGPANVVMNPLAALLFVLTGSVLLLDGRERWRKPARVWGLVSGLVVALSACLVLLRSAAGWQLGVDEFLFREKVLRVTPPDWMAENAALSFLLLGLALLSRHVSTRSGWRPALWLVLPAALMSLLVVIGYLYDAVGFITFQLQLPMALNTALGFSAACYALVAARPHEGVMALFVSASAGGRLTRRLLPALLIIPLVVGTLINLGMRAGWYGPTSGLALFTLATIVLSMLLTVTTAGALHRSDRVLRRRQAALVRAKEEADRANRAKSEFLSRMSHELRTPMNSILGFAQLLEMDDLSVSQARAVDRIRKAGDHLLRLINEVLDLARIESNRQPLSLESVRVAGVMRETLDLVRPIANQYGCRLNEGIPSGADCFVRADRQRITQVLLNLVTNGIKYNRTGGSVRFLCRLENEAAGETCAAIGVWDSGPGIAPERLGELFTPFARLGAEGTAVEGTGLGLALSKRFVEAMGGHIRVDSVLGVGSTFWVELPLAASPAQSSQSGAARREVLTREFALRGPASILYVEDNLANLDLIESIFAEFPAIRIIPALQGRLGLALAREHRPDLILLDLHLPDMSGEMVLQNLRADPRTRSIPVVIVSADATPGRIHRLRAAGVHDYLTKPVDIPGFLETVERLLSASSSASPATRPTREHEIAERTRLGRGASGRARARGAAGPGARSTGPGRTG